MLVQIQHVMNKLHFLFKHSMTAYCIKPLIPTVAIGVQL